MNLFDEDNELEDFEKKLSSFYNNQIEEQKFKASDLKISIMSATGSLNSIINLKHYLII